MIGNAVFTLETHQAGWECDRPGGREEKRVKGTWWPSTLVCCNEEMTQIHDSYKALNLRVLFSLFRVKSCIGLALWRKWAFVNSLHLVLIPWTFLLCFLKPSQSPPILKVEIKPNSKLIRAVLGVVKPLISILGVIAIKVLRTTEPSWWMVFKILIAEISKCQNSLG